MTHACRCHPCFCAARLTVVLCLVVLQPPELPPLRLPAAKRLVAIGDLHGDLDKVCVAQGFSSVRHKPWLGAYARYFSALPQCPPKHWSVL